MQLPFDHHIAIIIITIELYAWKHPARGEILTPYGPVEKLFSPSRTYFDDQQQTQQLLNEHDAGKDER